MGGSRRTSPSGGTAGGTGGSGGRVRMALPPSSIAAKEVSESAGTGRDPYQQPQDRLTRLAAAAAESLLFGTKLASDDDEDAAAASGSEGRLPHLKPVSDPWRQRSLAGPPLAALRSSSGLGGAAASRSTSLGASAAGGDAAARRFLPDAASRQVGGSAHYRPIGTWPARPCGLLTPWVSLLRPLPSFSARDKLAAHPLSHALPEVEISLLHNICPHHPSIPEICRQRPSLDLP